MTVTETMPDEAENETGSDEATSTAIVGYDPDAVPLPPPPPPGLAGVIGTNDHKTTGRLFVGFSLLYLVGALALWALVDVERTTADELGTVLNIDVFFQVFTLGRIGIVLMGVLPLLLGLAVYVVPLQLGAPSIALPRATALGLWTWILGGGLFIAAYVINGGFAGGRDEGVELALLSLLLMIAGLGIAIVAVGATVGTMRAEGMALHQVPAFSWSMFVASFVWLANLGVLSGNLILVWADFHWGPNLFGLDENQWTQVGWILRQPAIYALAIPVMGIIADVIPTMVGARQRQYGVVAGAIAAFGAASFGGWAQTAFDPTITQEALYIVVAIATILPVLAFTGGMGDMLRSGPKVSAGLIHAVLAMLLLLLTVVIGGLHVIDPLDVLGTTWAVGHTKLVLGVAILGAMGGAHHWGGKMWGKQPVEAIGRLIPLVIAAGVVVWAVPELISGLAGQVAIGDPSGVVDVVDGAEAMNGIAFVGGLIVLGGVALGLLNLARPMLRKRTEDAPADPWDGLTLEWATTSPPPHGNFTDPIPTVTSVSPLLDQRSNGEEA